MAIIASTPPNFQLSASLHTPWNQTSQSSLSLVFFKSKNTHSNKQNFNSMYICRLRVSAAKKKGNGDSEDTSTPSWAKPGSDELPPWARQESQKESTSFEVPFIVYLLASAITAIAAIGSIFEYVNQKPVFGVLESDSMLYAPILGFFAFTGIPTSAYLWYKSVQVANKEAEEQDRRDGYL